jgi:two-component system cell cycle sensor histidine kinase PleC
MNKINRINSKNNELFYKSLFQNNLEIMLLINPETSQIKDCNLSACNYYGYSYNKMLKLKITDINVLTQEQIINEMQFAKTKKRNRFYFKHRLSNGKIRDVEVTINCKFNCRIFFS